MLLALLLVPYVALTAMRPPQIRELRLPSATKRFLDVAISHVHRDAQKRVNTVHASWKDAARAMFSAMLIVGSSWSAVHSAVFLGNRWGISPAVLGVLVLAALTCVPNVIAAVRLAREGRGAAVVSESLNSNTLNILAGICLPALLIGFAPPSPQVIFAALWLLMKLVAIAVASHRHGLHRVGGTLLVVLYVIFAVVLVLRN